MRTRRIFAAIMLCGAVLRLGMWAINPPNNTYDDYLEPIALIAREHRLPAANECWECYQPPLYLVVSSVLLTGSLQATGSYWGSWRIVQCVSVGASLVTLWFIWRILLLVGPRAAGPRLLAIAVLAFLPRDIFLASFVGSDAVLAALVTCASYLYLRIVSSEDAVSMGQLAALGIAVVAASWTKQHGALALILLGGVAIHAATKKGSKSPSPLALSLCLLVITIPLALLPEIVRFVETGRVLVSNQHFYNYAEAQPPGSVDAVAFWDLRPRALVAAPFMDTSTLDSLWTEIYARLWFDYEPRVLADTPVTQVIGRFAYATGLVPCMLWIVGLVVVLRFGGTFGVWTLLLIQVCFLAVPILQTVRFPHFSSMKADFVVPAAAGAVTLVAIGADACWRYRRLRALLIGATVAIGVVATAQLWAAYQYLDLALSRGPVWRFPQLW